MFGKPGEPVGDGIRRPDRHNESVFPFRDEIGSAGMRRGYHRQPLGHRFQEDQPEPVAKRWKDENVVPAHIDVSPSRPGAEHKALPQDVQSRSVPPKSPRGPPPPANSSTLCVVPTIRRTTTAVSHLPLSTPPVLSFRLEVRHKERDGSVCRQSLPRPGYFG